LQLAVCQNSVTIVGLILALHTNIAQQNLSLYTTASCCIGCSASR